MNSQVDLKDILAETIVINPPHLRIRRNASRDLRQSIGLDNARFPDGTSGLPPQMACTVAHRGALETIRTYWSGRS
jgi:hypothetical protein